MKFQAVRGFRDLYPQDMAVLNWIVDGWRRVSVTHGFEEYEGPILEYLDLYTVKSGQEIVEQLFHLTDRGGRELALRPEMTPTLARMVAARASALPRPIKWFSVPRLCRAERPQRGRLREFFQWNIDIIGVEDVLADAECIFVAVDYLRRIGLRPDEVVVRISDRRLVGGLLTACGIPADAHEGAFSLLDKAEKIEPQKLQEMWDEQFGRYLSFKHLQKMLEAGSPEQFAGVAAEAALRDESIDVACGSLSRLWDCLERFGISEYCQFDLKIVRGLAYYTGIVFEIHDRAGRFRALAGGGRYDDLLRVFDGPAIPAVGFGMGDVVLTELLKELGRLPTCLRRLDVFVADADSELFADVLYVVGCLRRSGVSADFSYKRQSLSKQLRYASQRNARLCVIIGEEYRKDRSLVVKDMDTGRQQCIDVEAFLADPLGCMATVG